MTLEEFIIHVMKTETPSTVVQSAIYYKFNDNTYPNVSNVQIIHNGGFFTSRYSAFVTVKQEPDKEREPKRHRSWVGIEDGLSKISEYIESDKLEEPFKKVQEQHKVRQAAKVELATRNRQEVVNKAINKFLSKDN